VPLGASLSVHIQIARDARVHRHHGSAQFGCQSTKFWLYTRSPVGDPQDRRHTAAMRRDLLALHAATQMPGDMIARGAG
jgi:hypothetical protein